MRRLDRLSVAGGPVAGLDDAIRGRQRALRDHRLALHRHVLHCHRARSRWFAFGCAAELMHGLLAPRFVTTVAGVACVLVLGSWWA